MTKRKNKRLKIAKITLQHGLRLCKTRRNTPRLENDLSPHNNHLLNAPRDKYEEEVGSVYNEVDDFAYELPKVHTQLNPC